VAAALHLINVARELIVLERAFNDEAQLHTIAAHATILVLREGGMGKKSATGT
jgi:hypothetical protein